MASDSLSQIVTEKLDKNNFQAWKFRMTNFLMGKGYWEFITGNEVEPVLPNAPTQQEMQAFKGWHERARKVMYWLSISISDSMIVHIQDASTPKEAWDTLSKMYSTNTQARKMQLKQELHNVQRESMSINDYHMKVKKIADALASIGSPVEDDDLVSVTLNGLGKDNAQFRTSISVRENFPDFEELIALLISEEQRNGGASSSGGTSKETVFYSNAGRGRGRGRGGRSGGRGRNQNMQQTQENQSYGGGRGNSRGRGSQRGRGGWQRGQNANSNVECYYCGKMGHMAKDCYKKQNDIMNGKLQ